MSQIIIITRMTDLHNLHRRVPLRVWTTAVKVTAKNKNYITKKPGSPISPEQHQS